jgi:V8-like Glu-specific endopeptidase
MQNIERLLGFRIQVDDTLPPQRLISLKERAQLIASQLQLDPEEHFVYIHSLSIIPNHHTFLSGTKLAERVESVAIGFWVNPKQERNRKIRVVNHLFRDVLEPNHQYANYRGVQYTLSGSELEALGTFTNEIITFVHRSLPARHRKLKIAVLARPASEVQLRDSNRVVTRMDLRYERYTPIELPRRVYRYSGASTAARFVWMGPTRAEELHSFLQTEQIYLDVGELGRMMKRSTAVCRIEIPERSPRGTGVLIGPNLVLTNFHVFQNEGMERRALLDSAQDAVLRFGALTDESGVELPGKIMRLDPECPIVEYSPTKELDFILLRLNEPISSDFTAVPYSTAVPSPRDTLNILQYPILEPTNNALKLTLKPNAITGVYPAVGRVQYITLATHGASGAPCFNKNWEVIAIHRAEQSVSFGTRREGILFSAIHSRIKSHLEVNNA